MDGVTATASRSALALLLIDLQNAYFEAPELAAVKDELVARANELVAAAREAGRPVVLVRTEHERDRSTWTINMHADDEGFAFPATTTPGRPPPRPAPPRRPQPPRSSF